jgi:hypothetical protein
MMLPVFSLKSSAAVQRTLERNWFAFFGQVILKLLIVHLRPSFFAFLYCAAFEYSLAKNLA